MLQKKPTIEKVLSKLGIPLNSILVNVGDSKYTKEEDIRNFNNLDVVGSEGNKKQFIILVEKGKEGWNCRSLFGVALYRSPKSKVFVLQATMRCMRSITEHRLTAMVFLSKDNFEILDDELHKNFNMEIKELKNPNNANRHKYKVRVLPPTRTITLKKVWHEYSLVEKTYDKPVDFQLGQLDLSKYESIMYEKGRIMEYVQETGSITNTQVRELCGFTRQQARSTLEKMQIEGVIVLLGKGRYAKYVASERLL